MRIYSDRLSEQLQRLHPQQQFFNCYLLFGNEPLLLQESRHMIKLMSKEHGFNEHQCFTIDTQVNWDDIFSQFQTLSLFSDRQLIELDLTNSTLNAALAGNLLNIAPLLHPDTILLVTGGKLTKAQENAKWFKALMSNGCFVNCLGPDIQRLPQFVASRCKKLNLSPDPEAVQMLVLWHEGNLFALSQSLEKLSLLYPDGKLTLIRLETSLSHHNHYSVFHWIDALLAGKSQRAHRILQQLESEGTEAVILLRSVQKELLLLLKIHNLSKENPINHVLTQLKVWTSKQGLYQSAIQRLPKDVLFHLINLIAQAEIITKTQYDQSPWLLLSQLTIEICHSE